MRFNISIVHLKYFVFDELKPSRTYSLLITNIIYIYIYIFNFSRDKKSSGNSLEEEEFVRIMIKISRNRITERNSSRKIASRGLHTRIRLYGKDICICKEFKGKDMSATVHTRGRARGWKGLKHT